jgi:hypothetical protein
MRTRNVVLSLATLIALTTVSAKGENGLEQGTRALNPITLEGQIREVLVDGDYVIFRLYRQPYDFVAAKWLPMKTIDGRRLYACDLQERDYIHLDGDLDHKTVYANRIVLQRREQHVGGE